MKQTVDYSDFHRAFTDYNRLNNFPTGLRALFDYSEEKLSVVLNEHSLDSLDELRDHTQVIMVDDETEEDPTIVYQAF